MTTTRARPRGVDSRLFIAGCCGVIAAGLHATVAVRTFENWLGYALIGIVSALGLLLWSIAAFRRRDATTLRWGAALAALTVVGCLVNRALGVPFGPDRGLRWDVGIPDGAYLLDVAFVLATTIAMARGGLAQADASWRPLEIIGVIIAVLTAMVVVGGFGE